MTTKCAIVDRATKVDAAARKLREAGVDFIVVTDGNGRAIGVLTGRDIATRTCADRLTAEYTPVSEIMTRNFVTCEPGDELAATVGVMERERVEHVVVTDHKHRLLGLLGVEELAKAAPDAVARIIAAHSAAGPPRAYRTAS